MIFLKSLGIASISEKFNRFSKHFKTCPAQFAIESALHNVFELACENGVQAIREAAAEAVGRNMVLYLPDVGGPYCLSLWTWLHYPDVFERALLLFEVDHLSRWRRRKNIPKIEPNTSSESLAKLASQITNLLQREEGRGRRCTVEHLRRQDGTDCFWAYPDDFVHTLLFQDEMDKLAPQSILPTFEIVFVYCRDEGVLELNAKMPLQRKVQLEEIFCRTILGQPVESTRTGAVYDLNVLKEGPKHLETDPEDGVTPVVRRLRLAIPESRDTIILEADRTGGPNCIYRMLDEYINREKLPLSDMDVTSATIGLVLHPLDHRKPGKLTFDVARPNTCTLRNHRPDRVALAQKYLKRWGIAVA